MKRQKFVYTAHAGDKMEQKANFVYKVLCARLGKRTGLHIIGGTNK
jgi:tetrahydromethanopterin S-methyltransferase subunit G